MHEQLSSTQIGKVRHKKTTRIAEWFPFVDKAGLFYLELAIMLVKEKEVGSKT